MRRKWWSEEKCERGEYIILRRPNCEVICRSELLLLLCCYIGRCLLFSWSHTPSHNPALSLFYWYASLSFYFFYVFPSISWVRFDLFPFLTSSVEASSYHDAQQQGEGVEILSRIIPSKFAGKKGSCEIVSISEWDISAQRVKKMFFKIVKSYRNCSSSDWWTMGQWENTVDYQKWVGLFGYFSTAKRIEERRIMKE
jgi:hypothetical protein